MLCRSACHPLAGPLIRKYLLDNGHRVTVELRPDASLGDAIEADEQQRLAAAREAMGPADLEGVVASTKVSGQLWGCVHQGEWQVDFVVCVCVCVMGPADLDGVVSATKVSGVHLSVCMLRPAPHAGAAEAPSVLSKLHLKRLILTSVAFTIHHEQELKEKQETPDPPEALTCIPSLHLSGAARTLWSHAVLAR